MDLAVDLAGHHVETVVGLGWAGVANGELMQRASRRCDAFVTMDRGLEYQQNLSGLTFGVLVLRARSNRLADLRPLVPEILEVLSNLASGQLRSVGR